MMAALVLADGVPAFSVIPPIVFSATYPTVWLRKRIADMNPWKRRQKVFQPRLNTKCVIILAKCRKVCYNDTVSFVEVLQVHALEKIIVYYNHCKENDIYKTVIENILKNLDKVRNATIYDLAELCYASPTTISRLSRKMGYEGFSDFKISLVNCVRNYDSFNHFVPYSMRGSLEKSRSGYFSLLRKLVDEIEQNLDMEQIKQINALLHKSRKVYFYTCGNESVERHFQELLIISGKESAVIGLPQMQMENRKKMDDTTAVVFVAPVSIESGDVGESIQAAKESGASVILISDVKNNIYEKHTDIYLGFEGTLCAIDDQAFFMILTILLMDYRSTYLE